jgi:hypothetical protein
LKVLFAGPSLGRDLPKLRLKAPSIIFAGPAACGDVARATIQGATAIGIVDGRFEDRRAVWHKEILFALWSGVRVAGAASMGALRAAECLPFGMVGIGEVFRRYARGELMDDADVAQIHGPAELEYLPLSEPWVNIEPTLQKMTSAGVIDLVEFELLHAAARRLHYKQRTYRRLLESLNPIAPERSAQILRWVAANAVDQKRIDGIELMDWLIAQGSRQEVACDWMFSETSQWRSLLTELGLVDRHPFEEQL